VEKGMVEEGEGGVECGICYSYSLCTEDDDDDDDEEGEGVAEGRGVAKMEVDEEKKAEAGKEGDELPDIYCACGRQYHPSCLLEWCRSGTGRVVMNRVYGHCPYCEKSISCAAKS